MHTRASFVLSFLRRPACAAAVAAACAGALLPAQAALVQVTQAMQGNTFGPSVSADGQRVAFYSAADLSGSNADNSFEVLVYDRPSASFVQLSNHTGGPFTGGHQSPSISADGQRVAYQRFQVSGGFASFQTVLHDLGTGSQTTLTPLGGFETSTLSGDGNTVAVATGSGPLQLYDVPSASFGPTVASNPFNMALSFDGSVLAYEGFGRLDVLDRNTGLRRNIAPAGSGFNLRPDLSSDGRWLAYTAAYDPLGLNADRGSELFLYDLQTDTVRQLTRSSGDNFSMSEVTLSGDGTRMAFTSYADLLGSNADGNQEIFFLDLLDGTLSQLTHTSGFNQYNVNPSMSADGRTLAFISSADLVGANALSLPQLFLLDLPGAGTGAVPVPGTLPLVALAGSLLLVRSRRGVRRRVAHHWTRMHVSGGILLADRASVKRRVDPGNWAGQCVLRCSVRHQMPLDLLALSRGHCLRFGERLSDCTSGSESAAARP